MFEAGFAGKLFYEPMAKPLFEGENSFWKKSFPPQKFFKGFHKGQFTMSPWPVASSTLCQSSLAGSQLLRLPAEASIGTCTNWLRQ